MTIVDDLPPALYWCDDTGPGIRRRRAGKGFAYRGPDDTRITRDADLARIRALAVPPAWTDVWICPDAGGVTAKDFRTWMGTLLATTALAELPTPESERACQHATIEVVREVAAQLGNTPTVARGSYVHPAVIEWFADGTLPDRWARASALGSRLLRPEERKLIRVLRAGNRRRRAVPKAA